jgi:hypothetical protein
MPRVDRIVCDEKVTHELIRVPLGASMFARHRAQVMIELVKDDEWVVKSLPINRIDRSLALHVDRERPPPVAPDGAQSELGHRGLECVTQPPERFLWFPL